MFTQPSIRAQIKVNIKAPRHWPLCGEFTGDRWIPRTNGQLRGKCIHLMTSSWTPQSCKLDESTARRHLSPRPQFGRSLHLILITIWSWSWWRITYSHPICSMSIGPPILRYNYFKIWLWKSMVKVMCLVNGQAHIWPWKFKMVKVKPIGHIWGLELNRYVCFSFRSNRKTFGWDIANSISALENSRTWPRSNLMVTFEAMSSIDIFAFRLVAIGPFLAEI